MHFKKKTVQFLKEQGKLHNVIDIFVTSLNKPFLTMITTKVPCQSFRLKTFQKDIQTVQAQADWSIIFGHDCTLPCTIPPNCPLKNREKRSTTFTPPSPSPYLRGTGPEMPTRTHPVEGARGRDAGGAPPEVLDEVVHADVLVLHVRLGPNLRAAPRAEHGQEPPRADVRGRDQAQRLQIQALQRIKKKP